MTGLFSHDMIVRYVPVAGPRLWDCEIVRYVPVAGPTIVRYFPVAGPTTSSSRPGRASGSCWWRPSWTLHLKRRTSWSGGGRASSSRGWASQTPSWPDRWDFVQGMGESSWPECWDLTELETQLVRPRVPEWNVAWSYVLPRHALILHYWREHNWRFTGNFRGASNLQVSPDLVSAQWVAVNPLSPKSGVKTKQKNFPFATKLWQQKFSAICTTTNTSFLEVQFTWIQNKHTTQVFHIGKSQEFFIQRPEDIKINVDVNIIVWVSYNMLYNVCLIAQYILHTVPYTVHWILHKV